MTKRDSLRQEISYDEYLPDPTSWGATGVQKIAADWTGSGFAVTTTPPTGQYIVITDLNVSSGIQGMVHFFTSGAASPFWSEAVASFSGIQRTWRGKFKLPTAAKPVVAIADTAGTLAVLVGHYVES